MIEYKKYQPCVMMRENRFKDVNLSINDSEFMISGAIRFRKTTMLKMINQLIEPTDGNII